MAAAADPPMQPRLGALRVDYIDKPLGLQNPAPRFSWTIAAPGRDVRQSAYRIRVAADPDVLAGGPWLWDSRRVSSARSFDVAYAGPSLGSRDRRHWRVAIWLDGGDAPIESEASWWEMGLLDPDRWTAAWIAALSAAGADETTAQPAALLRRAFVLDERPVNARLYITAFGAYEAWISGRRVGDARLAPESTDFRRRGLYQEIGRAHV